MYVFNAAGLVFLQKRSLRRTGSPGVGFFNLGMWIAARLMTLRGA